VKFFKGEGEEKVDAQGNYPVIVNNIMYPNGAPEELQPEETEDEDTEPTEEESSEEVIVSQPTKMTTPVIVQSNDNVPSVVVKVEEKPVKIEQKVPEVVEFKFYANPLEMPAEIALKLNPADYSIDNLPEGFEKAPCAKPGPRNPEMSQEQYKEWMRVKYEFDAWENKLILWKIKLGRRIDECKKL